jgi:hypothetical protein
VTPREKPAPGWCRCADIPCVCERPTTPGKRLTAERLGDEELEDIRKHGVGRGAVLALLAEIDRTRAASACCVDNWADAESLRASNRKLLDHIAAIEAENLLRMVDELRAVIDRRIKSDWTLIDELRAKLAEAEKQVAISSQWAATYFDKAMRRLKRAEAAEARVKALEASARLDAKNEATPPRGDIAKTQQENR